MDRAEKPSSLVRWIEAIPVAGVDEAGRGCLAGPVTAAAVILPAEQKSWFEELNDSKQLNPEVRALLRQQIEAESLSWAVGWASVDEIDKFNILNATFLAMHRAIAALPEVPALLLIDGNRFRSNGMPYRCIVKGDASYLEIAAASILAKTHRDEYMYRLHEQFPQYGWDHNKAYATATHREAILREGFTMHHRRSFRLKESQLNIFFSESAD